MSSGRGQIVDHRVQHRLHALVLEGGAADDRKISVRWCPCAQAGLDLVGRERLPVEVLLHQLIVDLGDRLHRACCASLAPCEQLGGDLAVLVAARPASSSSKTIAFISTRSTTPRNLSSAPMGIWIGMVLRLEPSRIRSTHAEEVRAYAVHLVDERDARDPIPVRLAPDRLATGAGRRRHGAEHGHGAVEHAQRALDLDGEVDVAGGVDDVDPVECRSRSRSRWWRPR